MASLQVRSGSWRVIFRFHGIQHFVTIGEVERAEAQGVKARYEYLLRLLKQRLLTIPAGMDIATFLRLDGKPADATIEDNAPAVTFARLRDGYLKTIANGAVETNTLYTSKIHLAHVGRTLGEKFPIAGLSHADLQRHISRRATEGIAAVTIKKELDSFRSAWNWGKRMGHARGEFPGAGLIYPKGAEKLPFMTWAEIERRIAAGGDSQELWECLYLREAEIEGFLDFVQQCDAPFWLYPMCVMAAHTGARRSEMIRAEAQDVDAAAGFLTVREKKRVRGKVTTRRVPMSSRLKLALATLATNGRLFGHLTVQTVQKWFMRTVGKDPSRAIDPKTKIKAEAKRRTRWAVLKGYHVLRHSFISALANKGIDQRIIDELVGHQTEAMRRRYRHLYPQTVADAVKQVFG